MNRSVCSTNWETSSALSTGAFKATLSVLKNLLKNAVVRRVGGVVKFATVMYVETATNSGKAGSRHKRSTQETSNVNRQAQCGSVAKSASVPHRPQLCHAPEVQQRRQHGATATRFPSCNSYPQKWIGCSNLFFNATSVGRHRSVRHGCRQRGLRKLMCGN